MVENLLLPWFESLVSAVIPHPNCAHVFVTLPDTAYVSGWWILFPSNPVSSMVLEKVLYLNVVHFTKKIVALPKQN